MSHGEEFRRYMRALDSERGDSAEAHPGADQLRAYLESKLEAVAKERIERHLEDCPRCAEEMRDLRDFFEGPREGESELSETEIASAWQSTSRRLPSRRRISSWPVPPSALALAASVVLAVGLGVSTMRLELWNRSLESRLNERDARVQDLEGENQRLEDRGAQFEAEIAELKSPKPNALLVDLFSTAWVQRSGGGQAIGEVVLPKDAGNFVLILAGEGRVRTGAHTLAILGGNGREISRVEGLRQDPQGNFVLTLNRSFLVDGDYRLVLYQNRNGAIARVAEYALRVKSR